MKNTSFTKGLKINIYSFGLIALCFLVAGLPWFFTAFKKPGFTELTFTPVSYKSSLDKQSIDIFSDSRKLLSSIYIGWPIINFTINSDSTNLAVSAFNPWETLRIYDLKTQEVQTALKLPVPTRFLVFSSDNKYLVVAEEHNPEVFLIETKTGEKQSLTLPVQPLSLLAGGIPNELLIRAEQEIHRIQIEPLKILERNAKFEFEFGDEKMFLDPVEICFDHGVPHPLFSQKEEAMSEEGLTGFLFQPK